jgi:hypothetical protein
MALKQSAYAANLKEQGYGIAVYKPLSFQASVKERRIGDIAYFDSYGAYKVLVHAWDKEVLPLNP